MARQVKGARANKPNDSFGVLNNPNLYKNKYREEVDRDDDDDEVQAQDPTQEEQQQQEVATQEESTSFVESKQPAEEHDYKKRYDDLKKHYDAKLSEFKSEREQLASEIKAIKENMQSLPQGTVPPKSAEELQEFKEKYPDVKIGNSFALHNVLNKNLNNVVEELALGDFVAFSYNPTDTLNEISKSPDESIDDLNQIFEMVPNKKIGLFEISWSTSDFVEGDDVSQKMFVEKLFDFYAQNESKIEFMTWYRYIDQEANSCVKEEQKIGDQTITLGGGSSMGTSEHVIERLNQYNCNTGLVDVNQNGKVGWNEFKTQIQMLN